MLFFQRVQELEAAARHEREQWDNVRTCVIDVVVFCWWNPAAPNERRVTPSSSLLLIGTVAIKKSQVLADWVLAAARCHQLLPLSVPTVAVTVLHV